MRTNPHANARSIYRSREIRRIQGELERSCNPRLDMLLLVCLTGLAGFFASFCLLHSGWTTMASRYLAAITIAYVLFLLMLRIWLRLRGNPVVDLIDGAANAADLADLAFGGARSGSGAVDAVGSASDVGVGDALGAVEGEMVPVALVIGLIIAAVAIAATLFSVVSSAPLLFAELIVDGLLSASLYRRLAGIDQNHWLESAVRRTIKPFLLTAAIACATGFGLALYAPGAHSIGEAIHIAHAARR